MPILPISGIESSTGSPLSAMVASRSSARGFRRFCGPQPAESSAVLVAPGVGVGSAVDRGRGCV